MLRFSIITIFPNFFDSFLRESLLAKAIARKKIRIDVYDLRTWATDRHRTVDDKPYGGGPGMIMKADVWHRALQAVAKKKTKSILLDPAGKQFTQRAAQRYADSSHHLILCCGRYEGFDHRITKFVDERISIGPYVLNGGEAAAQVIIEATFRLVPGAIGNPQSLAEETHSVFRSPSSVLRLPFIEYPQYTRPEVLSVEGRTLRIPKMLLSGDHAKIASWRAKKTKRQ